MSSEMGMVKGRLAPNFNTFPIHGSRVIVGYYMNASVGTKDFLSKKN